jgi:hypothetical protein
MMELSSFRFVVFASIPERNNKMAKIAFAVATAAAIFMATPLFVGYNPAKAENLKMAQGVELQINRDRDDNGRRNRRERDTDVTVGVGPGGVAIGPRGWERCRTVTTTVERDDGRQVRRTERRCD